MGKAWLTVTPGFRKITNCDGEIAGTEGKMRAREQQKERVKLEMGAKLGIVIITDM